MAYPEYDSVARQAYRLWEERGRPDGRDLECWFDAEAELHRQVWSLAVPDGGPAVNNLDRALPPAERQRARAERSAAVADLADTARASHFVVLLGQGQLRIYRTKSVGRAQTQFELAESFQPESRRPPDTDQAGRSGARGDSIDERSLAQIEHDRQLVLELAGEITRFLSDHGSATWDYAAGPALHQAVLEHLPPSVRTRLGMALRKELVHQSSADLRTHFALNNNTSGN